MLKMYSVSTNIRWVIALLLLTTIGCSASRESGRAGTEWTSDCSQVEGESHEASENVKVLVDYLGADYVDADNQVQTYTAYDRLLYLDCNGIYQPGAATSWAPSDSGRTWVFDLREDLFDSNGNTIDAPALAMHYRMYRDKPFNVSAEALEPYKLAISFGRKHDQVPPGLLTYRFAVPVENKSGIVLASLTPEEDIRDRMEYDVEAVITRDPEIIAYANLRPEWTSMPLAWDRSYVLLVGAQENKPLTLPRSVVEDLAQSVSGPDIREHATDKFWAATAGCEAYLKEFESAISAPGPQYKQEIVDHYNMDTFLLSYSAQDAMTRTLAERIVALSSGAIDIAGSDSLQMLMHFDDGKRKWVAHEMDRIARTGLKPIHAMVGVLPLISMSRCDQVLSFYESGLVYSMRLRADQHLLVLPILDMRPRILIRDKRLRVVQDARNVMLLSVPELSTEEQ